MKVLITGARGLLGKELVAAFLPAGEVVGVDIDDFDVTDPGSCRRWIEESRPDLVLHAAAYTAVDACESNQEQAYRVNGTGTANMAEVCWKNNAFFVYYSTDYVFDGTAGRAYTEEDVPNPISIYGRSKYRGETSVRELLPETRYLILRTSWLFGPGGKNFVDTIVGLSKTRQELRIVDDQHGCPTYAQDLAHATLMLVQNKCFGTFHTANAGITNWYEFARYFLPMISPSVKIVPIPSELYPQAAARPRFSALNSSKYASAAGQPMPHWQDAVRRHIEEKYSLKKEQGT